MRFLLLAAITVLALAGCGGGGVPKRVFPPEARLQELRLEGEGAVVVVRVQSFSTVSSKLQTIDLRLSLAGRPSGTLAAMPDKTVLPGSTELVEIAVSLSAADRELVLATLAERRALRYRLEGSLTVDPPGRPHEIDFSSALSPVPGLDGVLR